MLAFLWRSTRGYRLRPWESPYLRWRIETYWGLKAEGLTGAGVRKFCWEHRAELWCFLKWAGRQRAALR